MLQETVINLALVLVLGVSAQWLAWRLKVPSILLLLLAGFLAGPIFGLLEPDLLLGNLLFPIVSLSVAVILFEGALGLRSIELRSIGRTVGNLLTVALLLTWALCTLLAYWLLGFDLPLSLLLGAILTVTGPTVVGPLLRTVRLSGQTGAVLKWESIAIDPIGAILAVLVYEALFVSEKHSTLPFSLDALPSLAAVPTLTAVLMTLLVGIGLGYLAARAIILLMRREYIPDFLHNPLTLAVLLLAFVLSNIIREESGLLTVTVMGFTMANQRNVAIQHINEFKQVLQILLIASLFILLAARIDIDTVKQIDIPIALFVLALIFVVRPISVLSASVGSGLSWRELAFIGLMAPRGIVAAAVSSLLALKLSENGYPNGSVLVPVTFAVIAITVTFSAISARPLARLLGLAKGEPQGILIVGAHAWAQDLGRLLRERGASVLLVDNNFTNIQEAKMQGIPASQVNVLGEDISSRLSLEGLGQLLALTSNDEVNSLASISLSEIFGRKRVYQLAPQPQGRSRSVGSRLRGHILANGRLTFALFNLLYSRGWRVRATSLTEQFSYRQARRHYKGKLIPLIVQSGKAFQVVTPNRRRELTERSSQTLFSLSGPVDHNS